MKESVRFFILLIEKVIKKIFKFFNGGPKIY